MSYQPHKIIVNEGQTNFSIPFEFNLTGSNVFVSINGADFVQVNTVGSLNETSATIYNLNAGDELTFLRKSPEEPITDLTLSVYNVNQEYNNIYFNLQELRYNYDEFTLNIRQELEDFEVLKIDDLYQRGDVNVFNINNVPAGWVPANGSLISTDLAKLDDKGYPVIGDIESLNKTSYSNFSNLDRTSINYLGLYYDRFQNTLFSSYGSIDSIIESHDVLSPTLKTIYDNVITTEGLQNHYTNYTAIDGNSGFLKVQGNKTAGPNNKVCFFDLYYINDLQNSVGENLLIASASTAMDSLRPVQNTTNIKVLDQQYWYDNQSSISNIAQEFYCDVNNKLFYLKADSLNRTVLHIRDGVDFLNEREIIISNNEILGASNQGHYYNSRNNMNDSHIYENGFAYFRDSLNGKIFRLDCASEVFEEIYDYNSDLSGFNLYLDPANNSSTGVPNYTGNSFNYNKASAFYKDNYFLSIIGFQNDTENNLINYLILEIDSGITNTFTTGFIPHGYNLTSSGAETSTSSCLSLYRKGDFIFICIGFDLYYSNNYFDTYQILRLDSGSGSIQLISTFEGSNDNIFIYIQDRRFYLGGSSSSLIINELQFIQGEDTYYLLPDFSDQLDSPDGLTRGFIKVKDI